jgi:hypothetical protein
VTSTEDRILAAIDAAHLGDPVHLTRDEWVHLQRSIDASNGGVTHPQFQALSPVHGLAVVIDHPKGYPTTVTPRPRKRRRR